MSGRSTSESFWPLVVVPQELAGHKRGHTADVSAEEVRKKPAGRHVPELHKKPAGKLIFKKPAQDTVTRDLVVEPADPKTKKRAAEVAAVKKKPAAIAHSVGADNKEQSIEEPPVKKQKPSVDKSPIKDPPVEEKPVITDDEQSAPAGESPVSTDEELSAPAGEPPVITDDELPAPAGEPKLGCSRCRFGRQGCETCPALMFNIA